MRRLFLITVVVAAAACNDASKKNDHIKQLTPDHVQAGCVVSADCDDNNPCTTDLCRADGTCGSSPRDCSAAADDCNDGVCDPMSGGCLPSPRNQGAAWLSSLFDSRTSAPG